MKLPDDQTPDPDAPPGIAYAVAAHVEPYWWPLERLGEAVEALAMGRPE